MFKSLTSKLKGWRSHALALSPVITVIAAQFGVGINVEDLVETLTNHYGKIAAVYGVVSVYVRTITSGEDGLTGLLKRVIGKG